MSTVKTEVSTINWPGKSGKKYKYWIYELPLNFNAKAGNYIFAKKTSAGNWTPIYIGETGDLSDRFDNHHKMQCIKRYGATHIHVHATTGGETMRLAEETDLTKRWDTPCNG